MQINNEMERKVFIIRSDLIVSDGTFNLFFDKYNQLVFLLKDFHELRHNWVFHFVVITIYVSSATTIQRDTVPQDPFYILGSGMTYRWMRCWWSCFSSSWIFFLPCFSENPSIYRKWTDSLGHKIFNLRDIVLFDHFTV